MPTAYGPYFVTGRRRPAFYFPSQFHSARLDARPALHYAKMLTAFAGKRPNRKSQQAQA